MSRGGAGVRAVNEVRELAEVSRPETVPIPGPAFSAETAAVVRARLGGAIPEMIEAIAAGVPDYASRARPDYQQRLADAVTRALACFIPHVARLAPAARWALPPQVAVVRLRRPP